MKSYIGSLVCALLLFSMTSVYAQSGKDPVRAIEPVAGDVFRFRNNFRYSLVVVTDEGVVVVNPINEAAATWLKEEIKTISGRPITHLIYSHSHLDHASGGSVYTDSARVVAQANAPADIDGVVPAHTHRAWLTRRLN